MQELYHQLKAAGYWPWLDQEDLLPGQNWRREIERVIRDPHSIIVVCLSTNSTTKRGVIQQEIKWALDILAQMPEDTIYLIPARLEACPAPERLADLHWVNLLEPDGFDRLKRALDFELGKRPAPGQAAQPPPVPRHPAEPELIVIPAGEFWMGTDRPTLEKAGVEWQDWMKNETPVHQLYLPAYAIGRYPVTNAEYARFIEAGGYRRREWWTEAGWGWREKEGRTQPGYWTDKQWNGANYPVVGVSWYESAAYCRWLSEVSGRTYRLPAEAEWEKAARGTEGRLWPWGNTWRPERCNSREKGPGRTTPVGQYSPDGDSPYGLADMVGNVWEWCATRADPLPPYPYPVDKNEWAQDYLEGTNVRVLRGGSWYDLQDFARCAVRFRFFPNDRLSSFGFRVVVSPI